MLICRTWSIVTSAYPCAYNLDSRILHLFESRPDIVLSCQERQPLRTIIQYHQCLIRQWNNLPNSHMNSPQRMPRRGRVAVLFKIELYMRAEDLLTKGLPSTSNFPFFWVANPFGSEAEFWICVATAVAVISSGKANEHRARQSLRADSIILWEEPW